MGFFLLIFGLGCWFFGGGDYWGFCELKDEEVIVKMVFEYGIDYLDIVELYNGGCSEELFGKIMCNIFRD